MFIYNGLRRMDQCITFYRKEGYDGTFVFMYIINLCQWSDILLHRNAPEHTSEHIYTPQ